MNTLFSLRSPSIGLGAFGRSIIAWPLGHGWARSCQPDSLTLLVLKWSLNPGPFNIKRAFYHRGHGQCLLQCWLTLPTFACADRILQARLRNSFQLMLVISTQSVGYGIAGMMRKFLV